MLELIDGRAPEAVEDEFLRCTTELASKAEARRLLAKAQAMLLASGIVEAVVGEETAT